MARTISARLAERAQTSFVGREKELSLLRNAISADELPFVVVYIHGIGGIGKSRLLQAVFQNLHPDITPIRLDCREIEPTEQGFLKALRDSVCPEEFELEKTTIISKLAQPGRRTVLALDTYETFGLMDTWLRQEFIPDLPDTVLVFINSRERPNSAWLTTPGWESLFHEIHLKELTENDAHEMLRLRGLNKSQIKKVNRFARGYPLALELACAAIKNNPDLEMIEGPPPKVLKHLTDRFLSGLPLEIKEAIEASSTVRRFTEPVLRSLLNKTNVKEVLNKLQELPFVNATGEGLFLHDLVRETISNSLSTRDPESYRSYRRRAWRYFNTESYRAQAINLWQYTADLLYLLQNPNIREAFFPRGASDYTVERATTGDTEEIYNICSTTEPKEAARLIQRWWDRHPETFSVARTRDVRVAAFYILFEPKDVDPDLLADDPLTAAWLEHLRINPLAPGERVLFLRRWLTRLIGEAHSPALAACWLDVKRTYMELRPGLRRLYGTVTDPGPFLPMLGPLGFVPLAEANVFLGGITYHTALLDFGPSSVDGWLSRLIGAELGLDKEEIEEIPEGTVTILFADIADSTMLTEKLSDSAFRDESRKLGEMLKKAITACDGKMVEGKLLGDGVLAVFKSANKAIDCAIRLNDAANATILRLHIGLHAGDVIWEGKNIYGGAVNIAARISDKSAPGEIIVSETVRSIARTSTKVSFEDRGFHNLKGVSDPHRLFSIKPDGR
jgi:class 3 adenylate cyclase